MKRRVVTLFIASVMGLSMIGGVTADPGSSNCVGQTTAFLARESKVVNGKGGIGNAAKAEGISVKEARAIVAEFCAVP